MGRLAAVEEKVAALEESVARGAIVSAHVAHTCADALEATVSRVDGLARRVGQLAELVCDQPAETVSPPEPETVTCGMAWNDLRALSWMQISERFEPDRARRVLAAILAAIREAQS